MKIILLNNIRQQSPWFLASLESLAQSLDPTVVYIGPLHHGDENLKLSEGLKRTYMLNLLNCLGSTPEEMLATCLEKVSESIQKIRRCYVGTRPYSDDELARMMVMDGCFILQFLSKPEEVNYLLWVQVNTDLLLVENQIPFFVLKDIFECSILKSEPNASLNEHFKPLLDCRHDFFFAVDITIPINLAYTHHIHHILSLLHKCYPPTYNMIPGPFIGNIVELEKAGVSFKPHEDVNSSLAMKIEWSRSAWFWFWVKPTLRIPKMTVNDYTEMILRNMIAYEQTSEEVVQYFTTYALAMDHLVDNGDDIAKLVDSKILFNNLGSNKDAANMINNIAKNIVVINYHFLRWEPLETYYNSYWPKHIAWLRRTYFNNPWNIIALIAGIILFVLTLTETYFTFKPEK